MPSPLGSESSVRISLKASSRNVLSSDDHRSRWSLRKEETSVSESDAVHMVQETTCAYRFKAYGTTRSLLECCIGEADDGRPLNL